MITKQKALELINHTISETLGCTEPVAIALAASVCSKHSEGIITNITVTLDKSVYKNAAYVGIPGTDKKGIKFAIALAIANTDPTKGLLIFENTTKEDIEKANLFLKKDVINVFYNKEATKIDIKVDLTTTKDLVSTKIEGFHDNIVSIIKNDKIIFEKKEKKESKGSIQIGTLCINDFLDVIKKMDDNEISFLKKHVTTNLDAAKKGLEQGSKKNIGSALKDVSALDNISDSFLYKVKYTAAAAASARMMGEKIPIIGCGGSGNHGITFFISIGLAHKQFQEKTTVSLQKALAFGLLLLISIKQKTGLLTPMCGCSVAAGAASAGAIAFMLGGDKKKIQSAINMVLATISGIICDGAKTGCSLKIATSVTVAIESAILAINEVSICGQGITGNSLKDSIDNLSLLHNVGMKSVDHTILDIFSMR